MSQTVAVENEPYDAGTKIWTAVFCVAVAAVLDWQAVVNPVRGFRPTEPDQGVWTLALIVAVLAPAAWFAGRARARQWADAVLWLVVVWGVVVAQIAVWLWAQSKL